MVEGGRKLVVFNQLSLDGYFTDSQGDISWAHKHDEEWNAFVEGNAATEGPLLFGRATYEMMAGFWPTPAAAAQMSQVAAGMNRRPKFVASRTLQTLCWENAALLNGDLPDEVRRLKAQPGENITILGSGSIVAQLAAAGLIDNYELVICPVALGAGRTLFDGINEQLPLKLISTRRFQNGSTLLSYERPEGAG